MRNSTMIFLLLGPCLCAQTPEDATHARDEALRALQHFNPASILSDYTQNPKEAALHSDDENDVLLAQGEQAIKEDANARSLYEQAHNRPKVAPNPNSEEMQYAERLLTDAARIESAEQDPTSDEVSTDIAEGISQLGALAGVASDVARNPVDEDTPAIFAGTAITCKKYPLNFRDCCTDSGWGDWVRHCPQELQTLQRAKADNRVLYLGAFKRHKLGALHFSYCVFPSPLAAIVQIQGRGGQLGIAYGSPSAPNCRGLSSQEIQRIDFAKLDLSSITKTLQAQRTLPNKTDVQSANQAHIEQMQQQERAHD